MKCDELKVYVPQDGPYGLEPEEGGKLVEEETCYLKSEVDAAIAELKNKLMPCLNGDCILTCEVVEKYGKENAELMAKLEDEKASHYTEMVDAGMRERRLRRTLWIARAERAKTEYNHWILIWHCELNNHLFFINKTRYKHRAKVDRLHYPWEWRDIWDEVERKCRAKAEEYK